MSISPQSPLGIGRRMINVSEHVKGAPINALPVLVYVDEFQALMSAPVVHGSIIEATEVVL